MIEEIVAVMRAAGDGVHGRRLRGPIVVLRLPRGLLAVSLAENGGVARAGYTRYTYSV
jgi:hypothetical protein